MQRRCQPLASSKRLILKVEMRNYSESCQNCQRHPAGSLMKFNVQFERDDYAESWRSRGSRRVVENCRHFGTSTDGHVPQHYDRSRFMRPELSASAMPA